MNKKEIQRASETSNESESNLEYGKIKGFIIAIALMQILTLLLMLSNLSKVNKIIKQEDPAEHRQEVDYDKIENLIKENKIDYELIERMIEDKEFKIEQELKVEPELTQPESQPETEPVPEVESPIEGKDEKSVGDKVGEVTDYLGEQFKKLIKNTNERLNE